jgi:ornithine carbamoyltransferase
MLETYSPNSTSLSSLRGLTVAWVGDSNNILNDMIVSFARLGIKLRVATPKGYPLEEIVMKTAREGLSNESSNGTAASSVLEYFNSPEEAVKGADIIVTDTW